MGNPAGIIAVYLKTGETRADYINRRLDAGASIADIHREINSPDLYSGEEGGQWEMHIVYGVKARWKARTDRKAAKMKAARKATTLTGGHDPAPATPLYEPGDDPIPLAAEQPLYGKLSEAEMEEIRAEARRTVAKDYMKELKANTLRDELNKLRAAEGMKTGNPHEDELVDFKIDVAQHSLGPLVNGFQFWHGQTYKVPRHVARSLQEMCSRTWQHQEEIDGKPRFFYRNQRDIRISASTLAVTGLSV